MGAHTGSTLKSFLATCQPRIGRVLACMALCALVSADLDDELKKAKLWYGQRCKAINMENNAKWTHGLNRTLTILPKGFDNGNFLCHDNNRTFYRKDKNGKYSKTDDEENGRYSLAVELEDSAQ